MTSTLDLKRTVILREAAHCPCSHDIAMSVREPLDDPLGTPSAIISHNGTTVEIPLDGHLDVNCDLWSEIMQQWASKARDLHRHEAMQSDWPVF